jgi:hypothetical protein
MSESPDGCGRGASMSRERGVVCEPDPAAGLLGVLGRRLKFVGCDHEAEAIGSAPQSHVERDEATSEDLGQGDVLSVVGFGPAELVGDSPCFIAQLRGLLDADRHLSVSRTTKIGHLVGDVVAPLHLVKRGEHLKVDQGWRDEVFPSEFVEAVGREAEVDCCTRVDDEHLPAQWPARERWTAATTFGIG